MKQRLSILEVAINKHSFMLRNIFLSACVYGGCV